MNFNAPSLLVTRGRGAAWLKSLKAQVKPVLLSSVIRWISWTNLEQRVRE